MAKFRIEFFHSDSKSISVSIDFKNFMACIHGERKQPIAFSRPSQSADDPSLLTLSITQLKEKSDEIRAQLEEKKRKEEEALAKQIAEAAAKAKMLKEKAEKALEGPATTFQSAAENPKGPTLSPCKVAIFYGSSTGNTTNVADMLKKELGSSVDNVKNITEISPYDFAVPEVLILGIPTWHIGELQDDWALMLPEFEKVNPDLKGKKVALFGLGDQKGYPDTYVDAMGELLEKFEKRGAKLHGLWPTEGYKFTGSKGIRNGKFMGLVIDVENQDDQSEARVKRWAAQIKQELSI